MRVDPVASAFRRKIAIVVLLAGAAIVAAQDARSVWDGVYTEDQAKRGEEMYFERCVRCHGPAVHDAGGCGRGGLRGGGRR